MSLYTPISNFLETLDTTTIATERKEGLNKLADFLQQQLKENKEAKNRSDFSFVFSFFFFFFFFVVVDVGR